MNATDSEKTDPLTGAPHDGRTKDLESALVGSEVHIGCDESPFGRHQLGWRAVARGPQRSLLNPRTFGQAASYSDSWALPALAAMATAVMLVVLLLCWVAEGMSLDNPPGYLAVPGGVAALAVALTAWAYYKDPEALHDARRDRFDVWLTNAHAANVASAALEYDNEAALQALRVLEKGDSTSLEARQLAASALPRLRDKRVEQKAEQDAIEAAKAAEQDAIEAAKAAEIQRLDEETNLLKGLPDELDMHELHVRLELNDN